jgi:hypothetical protein
LPTPASLSHRPSKAVQTNGVERLEEMIAPRKDLSSRAQGDEQRSTRSLRQAQGAGLSPAQEFFLAGSAYTITPPDGVTADVIFNRDALCIPITSNRYMWSEFRRGKP